MTARTLFTLAYPRLADDDLSRIDTFRRLHDPQAAMVAPHFTLVFDCSDLDERIYIEHVQTVGHRTQAIRFTCRYAMLGSGVEPASLAYVFLVPDKGFSALSRLHDGLYTGVLARHLRLDVPFVPHITLGTFSDRALAKQLCDGLNESALRMRGTVDELTIAHLEDKTITTVSSVRLGRQS